MDYRIRKAEPKDFKKIQWLNYKLFLHDFKSDPELFRNWPYSKEGEEYFQKAINDKKYLCLVAVSGKKIVGYLNGRIWKKQQYRPVKTAQPGDTFVLEKYRSKGIGSELVKRFVEWCKKRKVGSIVVRSYSKNKKALKFYQRNNFRPLNVIFELKL